MVSVRSIGQRIGKQHEREDNLWYILFGNRTHLEHPNSIMHQMVKQFQIDSTLEMPLELCVLLPPS